MICYVNLIHETMMNAFENTQPGIVIDMLY
jgi:hypothetical protein